MKRVFLDTNIVLDLLGDRHPFYHSAAEIASLGDRNKLKIFCSSLSFQTTGHLLGKIDSREDVINKLRKFRAICDVAVVNQTVIDKALYSNFSDFEDAVQYFSALSAKCKIIITRDVRGFKNSSIPIQTPEEFLSSNG